MKYYKLKKDLPTFEEGELFYLDDWGSLYRVKDELLVYHYKTVAKFPNMLEDWFEEVPASVRDVKTKAAFEAYMALHPDERFFQAVRNFTRRYLDSDKSFIFASEMPPKADEEDTFYWECDDMLSNEPSMKDIKKDCASKEPLIKDGKIRKAIRAWAEANSQRTSVVYQQLDETHSCISFIDFGGLEIEFNKTIDELTSGKTYKFTELCGEEE